MDEPDPTDPPAPGPDVRPTPAASPPPASAPHLPAAPAPGELGAHGDERDTGAWLVEAPPAEGAEEPIPQPSPALTRELLLKIAVWFYTAMGLGGLALATWGLDGPVPLFALLRELSWSAAAADLRGALIGLAVALALVGLMRVLGRFGVLSDVEDVLSELLGRTTVGQAFLIALTSSVGEEIFFRGWLQNAIGLWWASAIFGAVHLYGKRLWYYPLIAGALGLGLGVLYDWTGGLAAPTACHFAINFLNLLQLSRLAEERGLA